LREYFPFDIIKIKKGRDKAKLPLSEKGCDSTFNGVSHPFFFWLDLKIFPKGLGLYQEVPG
jgi:hypothetical protein